MHIAVYTPEKLKPPVVDILKATSEDYEGLQFVKWGPDLGTSVPILGLGAVPANTEDVAVKAPSQNQLLALPNALTDLNAAISLITNPPNLRRFNYTVWNTRYAGSLEEAFKGSRIFLVDIETGGDIKTWLPEEMWLLSVAIYDGKTLIVLSEEWLADESNRRELSKWLMGSGKKLIAHNMKFDFRTLSAQLNIKLYGHLDTQLLHHAMYPAAKEHGLKPLARKYLGAHDWDGEVKKWVKGTYKELPTDYFYPTESYHKYVKKFGKVKVGFEAIPRTVLYEYNAYDVYFNWHLYEYLIERADSRINEVALHEYRMSNFFQDIESWGIEVDTEHLDKLSNDFTAERDGYMEKLAELVSPDFNPNSPQQVSEVYESVGIKLESTDAKTLTALLEGDIHPTVAEFSNTLLDVRGVTKMLGTYNTGIRERMHGTRVFPSYRVHGTNTGRLSSTDPNIQNIPRDKNLRNLFTVRDPDRYDFLEVDYSQAELRVMAVLSQDEYLMSLFQPGMPDFFDSLLPVAFPKADISKWSAQERKDNRAKLKSVIYGLSYGRKAAAIAAELKMPQKEAQDIITNYFKAAPDFANWREEIEAKALDPNAVIETPFGRQYQAEIVTSRNRQSVLNSALSFTPQSTASDICVSAAIEIHKWMPEYQSFIVASIHDAINSEVLKEHTVEVAQRQQYEMAKAAERILGTQVPFATEAEWGPSWGKVTTH